MILRIEEIRKFYGKVEALKGVSLTLESGVYGLLGPNGAGKSTLIQIMTGNLNSSSGNVLYDGSDIRKNEKAYKKVLGYVPQSQGLYERFTAQEFLEYMAILKDVNKKEIASQITEVLDVVGLSEVRHRRVGGFSGGMKQRVLIAQALLGNPEIIILDEPTAGLDPKERIRIRNFISKIAKDKIVLIATHVVSDVETIAKEIVLLGHGEVVCQGTPEDLCSELHGEVWECDILSVSFEDYEQRCIVTNVQELPNGLLRIRFIGNPKDMGISGKEVLPNLQEVYLKMFSESR